MAKSQRGKAHIKWTAVFQGNYVAAVNGGTEQKPYEITVVMSQAQVDMGPISQFAQYYAPKLMPQLYPGYQNLATHELKSAECNDEDREADTLVMMNREKLEAYIEGAELDVDPTLYGDAGDLRQAIIQCEDDAEVFSKNQKILREKLGNKVEGKITANKFLEESLALNKERLDQHKEESLPTA